METQSLITLNENIKQFTRLLKLLRDDDKVTENDKHPQFVVELPEKIKDKVIEQFVFNNGYVEAKQIVQKHLDLEVQVQM